MQRNAESAVASPLALLSGVFESSFLRRVGRYGVVGVGISVFYSALVIACVELLRPISPTLASVIAFVVTLPLSFLAHSKVTFSDRPFDRAQPMRFVLTTTSSFVISTGGMYWITGMMHWNYLWGIAWNWMIIPASNFVIYLFWVFRATHGKGRVA